ncbi:MAG: DUF2029 domain-containing protein, partial [Candidatus Dormibacteraeota bacterium]|nr:DUF2029 domain-containing protein [Candidatus Dormibacteraeota bacterium]
MNVTALRRSRLGDQRLVLAAAIAVLAVIRALLILDAFHTQHDSGDIGRYQEIVTGGVPYRAQAVEYPPIAVLILEALHLIAPQRDAFGFAVITTMVLAEAALCVLIWRQFGRGPGFVFVALDTLLYAILLPRIDVLPTLFAAVFVASLGTRPVTAATAWVAAVGTKLWPLALAPLVLARRQGRVRTVVVASVGVVALVIGWAVVGGVTAFIDVVTYRGAKGWEIESVIGSVVRAVTGAVVQQQQGAARIGVVPPILGPALLAAGAAAGLLLCILAARAGRP